MAKVFETALLGKKIPKALIKQLEGQLPTALLAQMQLPGQQEEFKLVAESATDRFFDDSQPDTQTKSRADVLEAEKIITGQSDINIETEAQKKKRLEIEASSARNKYKATPWMPSMPRRFSSR